MRGVGKHSLTLLQTRGGQLTMPRLEAPAVQRKTPRRPRPLFGVPQVAERVPGARSLRVSSPSSTALTSPDSATPAEKSNGPSQESEE